METEEEESSGDIKILERDPPSPKDSPFHPDKGEKVVIGDLIDFRSYRSRDGARTINKK